MLPYCILDPIEKDNELESEGTHIGFLSSFSTPPHNETFLCLSWVPPEADWAGCAGQAGWIGKAGLSPSKMRVRAVFKERVPFWVTRFPLRASKTKV